LRRLLHRLDPETAHRLAIRALPFLPARRLVPFPRLRTTLAGLDLAHPIGLAAGFDKNAEVPDAMLAQGFSWVEVGTVTPRPQAGNPRPRVFRLVEDEAVINRLGFNNEGLEAIARRLERRAGRPGVVGANIGMNKDVADPVGDYVLGLRRLHPLVDYLTVNVSSPNTPGLRRLQGREPLRRLLEELLSARAGLEPPRRPLFLKIAPDLDEAGEAAIAEVALALGIDGLIVSNTTITRPPGLRSPHRDEAGGLSGRPLMAPSTALLARMRRRLGPDMPLVGVGGIATGRDVTAKLAAGANAVQLYTALVYRGLGLVPQLLAEHEATSALLDDARERP
jgi:dihydroorotate dehydrogenase